MLHMLSSGQIWRGSWHGTQVAIKMLKKDGVVSGSDVGLRQPNLGCEITGTDVLMDTLLCSPLPVKLR